MVVPSAGAMRVIGYVRSLIASARASAVLGRASRLQNEGKLPEALAIALAGLAQLRKTYVSRVNPPEAAVLATLTALAEAIAWELKVPGATQQDLIDTLVYLNAAKAANKTYPPPELCAYIPFLESRLTQLRKPSP